LPRAAAGLTRPGGPGRFSTGYLAGVTIITAAQQPGASRPLQPRALIVTIYGLYARESGGWLSVAALIRLLAGLGVDEPAVRSAISRLKQRGLLEPRRESGSAGYALSARGQDILAEGDRRIFGRPRASAADGWLLAVFSVPEPERRRRHLLRSRLAWLGFGTVSAGVWIAPGQLADETRQLLDGYQLSAYVDLFLARYLAFGDAREQVGRWWDLDRLDQLYRDFIGFARPLLERWSPGRAAAAPGAAFADYVRVLTQWRRLPYLDPGLPAGLLPPDWNGARAAADFAGLRELLAGPAAGYVREVTGPAPAGAQGTTA
jgi:phenylacetic acid degradation operon negative regulatory protein